MSKKSQSPNTRAESNRRNSAHSTGPRTPEGKAASSANSLKTGFFAAVETLHPADSEAFQQLLFEFRTGMQPDGPVEELLIRDLAMLRARLNRLEAAEYALICAGIDSNPSDARELATTYSRHDLQLAALGKAETHLRRAYNRTFDRLERIQRERHKLPLAESLKRSQVWLTAEAQRNNRPQDIPSLHPILTQEPHDKPPRPAPRPDVPSNLKPLSPNTRSPDRAEDDAA